jgi:hypothetical protein
MTENTEKGSSKNPNGKTKIKGFIPSVLGEGNVVLIYGAMGSGKTNFSSYLMETAVITYGIHVHTNIGFFKEYNIPRAKAENRLPDDDKIISKPENIHYFNNISDLFLELCKHDKNIVFIDEAGILASSSRATSRLVRTFKELTYLIRHFNASAAFICQSPNSIVPDLRENLVTFRIETKKENESYYLVFISKKLAIEDEEGNVKDVFMVIDRIGGIQQTILPVDSKFIPSITMDIKLEEMLEAFKGYDSIEIREKAPEIISKLKSKNNKGSNVKHVSASIYAEIKNISIQTVYRYIKNGKIKDFFRTPGGHYRIALDV